MEVEKIENFSLSDVPVSAENIENSVSIFTEFSDNCDEKLTKKSKSQIDQAFHNISSAEMYQAVSQELRANQPNVISPGTVGEYLYNKISKNSNEPVQENNSSIENSRHVESQNSVYIKSGKGLNKIVSGSSDTASIYASEKKYSNLTKEEYSDLYEAGIRKVDILNSTDGRSYSKVSLGESSVTSSSESEEGDAGSRSPNVSNTSSPNSKSQGYTIEYTTTEEKKEVEKKEVEKKKPNHRKKKSTGYGWIALLIIIIVIVLVLVAIVWACRRSTQSVQHSSPASIENNTPVVSTKYVEKSEYAVSSAGSSCDW